MTKCIQIPWKSVRIHIPALITKVISLAGDKYKGTTANSAGVTLEFDHSIESAKIDAVLEYWSSLDSTSEQAKFDRDKNLALALSAAKARIPYEHIEFLTPAEKKVLMGLDLSNEDEAQLLTKYRVS